ANAIANADGKITEEERKRIAEARKNLDTAIAKATEAETKAKSYADSKKQEAIKAAENLALEKSNLAKKYANDVATAKANLAKTEAIANADGKISAEEKKRIQQAQENLNTAISKADKAKQDAINEANRVAELKKQEAISSANSHADNKANEALNNAKAFVNAEITTVNSHLNKATAEINVLKEKIESKVSQSDIDKSIQNIKFNDVNMILNSGEFKDKSHWSITNGDENLLVQDNNLIAKFKNYAKWGLYVSNNSLRNKPLDVNKDYTVVCKLKSSVETSVNFQIIDGDGGNHVYSKELNLNNEWKLFKFTFKPYQVGNQRQFRFISGEKDYNFDLYINFVKMVEGATSSDSWSMAPDYVLDNIKTVTDKISTVESKFTQENNSIKASVQDLNSTTQSITTNVSNINRDLTSKINSNLDAAKSFATDIAIAKANLAKEQAIANADGKITAEEQKRIQQAQTNLNTAIAKATEAETKAKSYADVKKQEAINSANNNTNNAINNIKIGGRNYGLNTDVMQQEPYNIIFSKDLVFEKGKTYTISMDFDLENLVKGSQERVGCEGSILFKDGTRQYIGVWHWISQGATFKGRKSYTFTIENKDIKDNMTSIHIYTELVSSGKRNLGRFKIEEGNKATDYTIAPEDLQSYADKVAKAKADLAQANAIANADGKITEEERKRIQQAQENLNTAIARADKAKQDAINTASSDATNKANNALNSAKAFVNAEITTVNNKVHNVESNLNILSNEIKSKVSQSDINKSIQEIKIGGRNLIVNSDILQNLFSPLSGYSGTREVIEDNYALCKKDVVFKCTHSGTGFHLPLFTKNSNRIGKTYTWSFWAKCSVNKRGTIGHESNGQTQVEFTTEWKKFSHTWLFGDCTYSSFTFYIGWNVGEVLYIRDFKIEEGTKATDWTPAPEDTNQLVVDSIKVVDTKISDVSSSVTQLRDSVTTQINSINSKTHSIETALGGKASKQEVTEVNNRVTTIKASLDGITQRVSATESKTQTLETNLNGKASKQEVNNVSSKVVSLETNLNGITNRVSNTESRINTLDGKVTSAVTNQQFTEFKQSNDKFKFTVEQRSSVSNILPNGSFFGGDRGWLHNGSEFWAGAYSGYGFKGRITGAIKNRAAYNNPERYLQTHKAYKVKKNTTYTINFHYICEKNVQSMDAFVVLSNTEYGDYAQPLCILTAQGGSQSNAAEEKPFTYKFNTGNHEWVWLRFDHNGMKSGVNWDEFCWIYVSEVGIYEGDVGAVKWTPKGGEVYSANYQMDGLGFKGTFEDGTYASLGKDGLEWYNAGTGHAYHALTYVTSFDIPVGNPGKAYIKLPAEFTKRRSSLKWTVALRGYYYNTTGNFFPFHVHCTGARDYIENGLVVCEVQGLCKIQNGSNSGDVQFRPLTAMLIAIA
ncbi:TPA: phage tail spike protein, partial [Clostridium perfringens]